MSLIILSYFFVKTLTFDVIPVYLLLRKYSSMPYNIRVNELILITA